ncbi:MAG: type IV pilus assembly protein PilM [Syntrophobacteraceae bacterium]|nr:type IV pilus assembly protein PilM [Syntrophobacteraceae bacterium]
MGLFSKEITGIDIGAGSIKVVRMRNGQRPKLLSAAIVEMPLDPSKALDISTNLRYLLSGKHIGRSNVITQMPGKDLTIRSLTLPKMPQAELTEAVRWESKRHLSYPLDTALVEYLVVGEKQEGGVGKHDIVMVAAERGKVLEHLKPFDDTAIKVSAVDANALALRNVLRLRDIPSDVNTVIVDIGAGKMEINIFKNGVLRFSRCVESGGADMTRAVADALGIGLMEAEEKKRAMNVLTDPEQDQAVAAIRTKLNGLLMEIRRSVEYYKTTFREKSVEKTVLTGGVSLMSGIRDYCAQSLEGPVEIDQPFDRLACRKDLLEEFGPIAPRFSSAIGLALRRA